MTARIWPGALCVIVRADNDPDWLGRVVTAVRREVFAEGPAWHCDPPCHWLAPNGVTLDIAWDERDLVPITPPPASDTTEDRAPVEHGIAHA